MTQELKPIENSGRTGDVVHASQRMAGDVDFKNVSRSWYKKTLSYDQGFEAISADRSKTVDLRRTDKEIRFAVAEGRIGLIVDNGATYYPNKHALGQISSFLKIGTTYPEKLAASDEIADKQLLSSILTHEMGRFRRELEDRGKDSKTFLLRTRDDGTLRAWLSGGYGIINNEWVLEVVAEAIPGGRLSHWRGNSDTIYGNVLIPDSIREEEDSEYGAMLSLSNCEIGTRTLSQVPSTFRAICMNGCIWDQRKGIVFKQRHKGAFDLIDLKNRMILNINKQIPLAKKFIDKLLATRELTTDVNPLCIIAEIARTNKLTRTEGSCAWGAFTVEGKVSPGYEKTLFGIVNAFTRAAQAFPAPQQWVKFDEIGGSLGKLNKDAWDSLCIRASHLKSEEIERVIDPAYFSLAT